MKNTSAQPNTSNSNDSFSKAEKPLFNIVEIARKQGKLPKNFDAIMDLLVNG